MDGEKNCSKPSTRIGRKAWKQAGQKRKKAPEEPPTGENGKKGKERTEGQVVRTGTEWTKESEGKGKARKRKQKGSTSGTAVGAKLGRMKGNKQKAEYEETKVKHGKLGRTEVEKQGSRKTERQHLKSS